jgi:hypothetical protein
MADITYKYETYNFGDEVRQRLTWVTGTGLKTGNPTKRLVASKAPQPLSQYPLGSDTPGYRLEHTERGHIIGLQFGGPESKYNLVPMYADYNGGSGAWGKLEQEIKKWLDGGTGRKLGMDVSISYENSESAIPSTFAFTINSECTATISESLSGFNFYVHPPAYIKFDALDEDDLARLDVLKKAQKMMMQENWFVETSGAISIPGSGRSMRSGVQDIPVAVGGVDLTKFDLTTLEGLCAAYASRPYAVLDYLWFKHRETYSNVLKFAPVTKFDNTQPFSEAQRSTIQKVNILAHLGYMVSDLAQIIPEQETYPTLFIGSTDASAQVDHITGKAGSGSNCYSNARLVSKKMNLALNQSGMQAKVNAVYEDKTNWGAMSKVLMAFWTGL